jgi:hypothetical protein
MNENRPADAGQMTDEERAAWIERVRTRYAEQRARGVEGREPTADERLAELESDANAGRVVKLDLRLSPDEKLAWYDAARVMGLSTSEWMRDVLNEAAREVLEVESLQV